MSNDSRIRLITPDWSTFKLKWTVWLANQPESPSKLYGLGPDNNLELIRGGGGFWRGTGQTHSGAWEDFINCLRIIPTEGALSYGTIRGGDGEFEVVAADKIALLQDNHGKVIARTRDYVEWRDGPGVFFIDIDVPKNPAQGGARTLDEILEILFGVAPVLRQCTYCVIPSASSFLYRLSDGDELKGPGGWHVYFPVLNATEIPQIGKRLEQLLWIADHGRIEASEDGRALVRTLIDCCVWQPERLDFAGGCECEDGLEQRREVPYRANLGGILELAVLPKANAKLFEALVEAKKEEAAPELAAKKEAWMAAQLDGYKQSTPDATANEIGEFRAKLEMMGETQVLPPGYTLYSKKYGEVTPEMILRDSPKFKKTDFRPPNEPHYRNGKDYCARLFCENGHVWITSFAHGSPTRFYLLEKPEDKKPETPAEMDLRHALTNRAELSIHRDKLMEELEQTRTQGSDKETRKAEKALRDCNATMTKLDHKIEKLQAKAKEKSPFMNGNGKALYASQIADYLVRERIRDLLYDPATGTWYRYKDGYHQAVTKHALQVYIRDLISEADPAFGFTPKMAGDITDCVSTLTVWPDDAKELEKAIPFQNGVLRTDTMEFIGHRKEHWFRHVLPFDYAEGGELATEIREFFELIVDKPEHIELLQAIFRTIICGDLVAYQIFIVFIGDPGSGKSTIFDLLVEVVGERFTCATDLRRLEESPFEAAKFFGKKLAIIDDCHKYPGEIQRVKSIVTGGLISLEKKGKDPVDFRNEASLVLASNFPIKADGGTERRILYFPLPHKIKFAKTPTEERLFPNDPVITERVKRWKREGYISSVITWALGMPEARQKELLTHTEVAMPSIVAHQIEYMLDTNEVLAWLRYYVVVTEPTDRVEIGSFELENGRVINSGYQAYPSYCKMCQEHGRKPKGRNAFANELRSFVETRIPVKGVRYAPITRGDRQGVKALWGVKIVEFCTTGGKSPVEIFFGLGAGAEMPINALCNTDNVIEMGRPQLLPKGNAKQRFRVDAQRKGYGTS